ncbi:MAG: hypothetical protein IKZ25_04935 [Clostridia bacterium]|nr:hypothetical protein [Clostridia bacterium]
MVEIICFLVGSVTGVAGLSAGLLLRDEILSKKKNKNYSGENFKLINEWLNGGNEYDK